MWSTWLLLAAVAVRVVLVETEVPVAAVRVDYLLALLVLLQALQ
jgi:hypothetical protein